MHSLLCTGDYYDEVFFYILTANGSGRCFISRESFWAGLTFSDVVEDNVDSVAENAALQGWTVQVEAVHAVLGGIIVKNGQITGNCKRKRKVDHQSGFVILLYSDVKKKKKKTHSSEWGNKCGCIWARSPPGSAPAAALLSAEIPPRRWKSRGSGESSSSYSKKSGSTSPRCATADPGRWGSPMWRSWRAI